MKKILTIACVFPEIDPFSKAGGLGDFGRSFPRAMQALGHRAFAITPLYGVINKESSSITSWKLQHPCILPGNKQIFVDYYVSEFEGVTIYFIDVPKFFSTRPTIYNASDNSQRFFVFDVAVLELIRLLEESVDIVHCNDWHCGLLPYLLHGQGQSDDKLRSIASVFTIHNLTFQMGKNWWNIHKKNRDAGRTPLPRFGDKRAVERINFARRAIVWADALSTVSETYANEILTEESGEGLSRMLSRRRNRLSGILNGIDYEHYNPATDPGLFARYNSSDWSSKAVNKAELQKMMNLPVSGDIPLLAMATRITEQKGFDLLFEILGELLSENLQLVVFGAGEERYEKMLRSAMKKFSTKMAANLAFDSLNVTKVYAGSDMFLMPSRFEPCGLGQLISLRYGSVPIARATGGIADTVIEMGAEDQSGNGFVFYNYDSADFLSSIRRALVAYGDKSLWNSLVGRGMRESFSWQIPAKKYEKLFYSAIEYHKIGK
ncbi:MAG: starch synthase [Parcubacteria group bacterium Gr01-1014_18]|nr:MAG: starch synthase [Parcubacteria group bacterium Greene0416_36]TSC81162.1 MAG: starch synthase [Parcubacteria group bacterium Gr01-1014_18]TSC99159.1 MAG: starch synthase [Parcubacteria group bacterium Greene1014_20]TSD07483.1 MAG: starch synthase [Parcubacteria group bacterium Greene0714_2]